MDHVQSKLVLEIFNVLDQLKFKLGASRHHRHGLSQLQGCLLDCALQHGLFLEFGASLFLARQWIILVVSLVIGAFVVRSVALAVVFGDVAELASARS